MDDETIAARLLAVNTWVVHARQAKSELLRRLADAQQTPENRAGRGDRARVEADIVTAWAAMVGSVVQHNGVGEPRAQTNSENQQDLASMLLIINGTEQTSTDSTAAAHEPQSPPSAAEVRVRLRREMVANALANRRSQADASMLQRSEVVRWLKGAGTPVQPRWIWLRHAGLAALGLAALMMVFWFPITLIFWIYSWFFPLIQLPLCFVDGQSVTNTSAISDGSRSYQRGSNAPSPIACALSFGQLATVVAMATLLPAVRSWQRLRLDLVGMEGFPTAFYGEAVLREVARRVAWADQQLSATQAQAQAPSSAQPPKPFNTACSICLEPLFGDVEDEECANRAQVVVALPLCLHGFHKECIYQWLADHRSCPNCRHQV